MNNTTPPIIRLTISNEVRNGLRIAKRRYPTLSDPEILKLGLAKLVTEYDDSAKADEDKSEIRRGAARALGDEYLSDPEEDVYNANIGKRVSF